MNTAVVGEGTSDPTVVLPGPVPLDEVTAIELTVLILATAAFFAALFGIDRWLDARLNARFVLDAAETATQDGDMAQFDACRNCRRPLEWVQAIGWLHGELPQYAHEDVTCTRAHPVCEYSRCDHADGPDRTCSCTCHR